MGTPTHLAPPSAVASSAALLAAAATKHIASKFLATALLDSPSTCPSAGWYPLPVTRYSDSEPSRARTAIRTHVIWLVVSVPVLSEQITVVHPSVSTLGRRLTIAFFWLILRVPSARHVVMTAGRPSGMAATAKATAILK